MNLQSLRGNAVTHLNNMNTLLGSLIGQQTAAAITSPQAQQAVNTAFTQAYTQYQGQGLMNASQASANAGLAQQMSTQQYNSLLGLPQGGYAQQHNPKPDWVFAGTPCRNAEEFADRMWPEACAEKTMFVLKWAGRTASP